MVVKNIKLSLKIKKKDWLSIEKIIIESGKTLYNDQSIYFLLSLSAT